MIRKSYFSSFFGIISSTSDISSTFGNKLIFGIDFWESFVVKAIGSASAKAIPLLKFDQHLLVGKGGSLFPWLSKFGKNGGGLLAKFRKNAGDDGSGKGGRGGGGGKL